MIGLDRYIDGKRLFGDRYKLLRPLSTEGGTADVWLAEDAYTADVALSGEEDEIVRVEGSGVRVAIKIYRPKNMLDVEGEHAFRQEFKTVFDCRHANLLQPTDFAICDGMPYLVMPFCENGSAEQFVGRISRGEDLWKFLHDVSSGLAYLHACRPPIIHQDIKPANILVDMNRNYCITDFGISVKSGGDSDGYLDNEGSGTTIYMPPDRFEPEYRPIAASDVWALGATVYELITGDVPFADGGKSQLEGAKIPQMEADVPARIRKLVFACLDRNPRNRPTARDIAELARTQGKRSVWFYAVSVAVILSVSVCIAGWFQFRPRSVDRFTALCDSGDSIVDIAKRSVAEEDLVNTDALSARMDRALLLYENALKQQGGSAPRREGVGRRIRAIIELSPLIERYSRICDTLHIARTDDLPLRVQEFSGKRQTVSNAIKSRITEL